MTLIKDILFLEACDEGSGIAWTMLLLHYTDEINVKDLLLSLSFEENREIDTICEKGCGILARKGQSSYLETSLNGKIYFLEVSEIQDLPQGGVGAKEGQSGKCRYR